MTHYTQCPECEGDATVSVRVSRGGGMESVERYLRCSECGHEEEDVEVYD